MTPTAVSARPLYDAYRDERSHLIRTASTLLHLRAGRVDEAELEAHARLVTCATHGTLDEDLPQIRERIRAIAHDMDARAGRD